jgi:outer membrane lipoprotein LolB
MGDARALNAAPDTSLLISPMDWLKTCAALAAAAALAGCAMLQPERPAERARAFDLVGRVAVNHEGRAFSGGVRWEHTAERDEIWLLTPVGQALAHIVGDAQGATYTGADRSRHSARDIASLTRRALGWGLPIEHLSWWVQGAIAPAAVIQHVERDEHGRLVTLGQEGWRIAYTYSAPAGQGGRPRRLDIAGGAQEVRLVIDSWREDSVGPVRQNP